MKKRSILKHVDTLDRQGSVNETSTVSSNKMKKTHILLFWFVFKLKIQK